VVSTIRADVVAELLGKGAALSLDDVDQFAQPVADLVRDVERLLREAIGVTAYLSGGSTPRFAVHGTRTTRSRSSWSATSPGWPAPSTARRRPLWTPPSCGCSRPGWYGWSAEAST
jgi:hypothetical protein